jgi:hypothetical protein
MDDADEHHFIEGDITTSNRPVAGRDRNVLAALYSDQFPRLIATLGTNAPTRIV